MVEGTGERTDAHASIASASRESADRLRVTAPSWTANVISSDPLERLRRVAAELGGPVSLDRIATVVAEAAVKTLDADSILVAICEEVGGPVRVVHESGLSPTARQRLPAVLAAASSVLRTNGGSEAAPLASMAQALVGHRSSDPGTRALAAAMPTQERPLGVVFVGRAHGRPFSQADQRFLNALAAVAALALKRLRFSNAPRHLRFALHHHYLDLRFPGSDVQVGDMQIDLGDQEVVLGDRRARLTPSELRILLFLAAEPGRARTRREILRHVWHTEHVGDERACDAHISNLRRKIERDPSRPNRVVTVRGVGYALQLPRSAA
jgi:DNA-binding winged helix-turn-helix (wHTH) protein